LSDLLRRPEIQQFAQRISYDHFLGSLETVELVEKYIRHRLSSVADRDDYFEPGCFDLIFSASGGTPRLINLICDTSLVYGFAEELQSIPRRIVEQVLADKKLGLAPLRQEEPVEVPASKPVPSIEPKAARTPRSSFADSIIERAMTRRNEG